MPVLAPSHARAEDIAGYETDGDADAGGTDPRVAALDEAFSRAAAAALHDLLDAETRKAHKAVLDREVVGRARLWIAKFTVTRDETADGRRQLTVMVRVDRDKMRARLGELNIATPPPGEQPRPGARTVVVLLRIATPDGARATYGATAEKELAGLGALGATLREAGMQLKRATASGPAARPTGDLPLEDTEADALAAEAKADLAAIAGVTVGAPVAARGVAMPGVLVTAHVRLVGRGGKVAGQGAAVLAARGSEPTVVAAAIERALVAAASDVVPPVKASLGAAPTISGDDHPIGEPGVVLVRLSPRTPWGLVQAEQKYLAGTKGVQRAVIRRLSPGGWVIGVTTTESVERIAAIARKPPATDVTPRVKIVGDIIEVTLAGAP